MSKVDILLLPPECEVCGHEVHHAWLRSWNGKDVCTYCIQSLNEEMEHHDSTNHH